jgi:hypothetical protein
MYVVPENNLEKKLIPRELWRTTEILNAKFIMELSEWFNLSPGLKRLDFRVRQVEGTSDASAAGSTAKEAKTSARSSLLSAGQGHMPSDKV